MNEHTKLAARAEGSEPEEAANLATMLTPEDSRRLQHELMATTAEKRMLEAAKSVPASGSPLKSDSGRDLKKKIIMERILINLGSLLSI
ncbi:hypothetical protein F3Y22_tig00112231pilonHSYRG00038 [Hibiscus syriacus]|uniref:Uncharacterized protein n=1 Tax=Hibiscus syriacus TaxID=106335 RepID=A0A6A2X3D5_HIBSY|nr:hypothetical protein F3Y22_tig00112231pilonHSYRG00038 [Hibiscus syriacus]